MIMMELTRDQIQQMTPEQQETVAQLETQRVKRKLALIDKAKGSGPNVLTALAIMTMLAISLVCFSFELELMIPLLILIILISTMCQLVASSHQKQLDALFELVQEDDKQC
jgi:hypothetical protein